MTSQIVNEAFAPVLGRPAWRVEKGHSSFLTMEFGEPSLEIREPSTSSSGASEAVRRLAARRLVTIHGEWHLWIYCCHWAISRGDQLEASDESTDDAILGAASFLDGQILRSVEVPGAGSTVFRFDLGGVLATRPYIDGGEDEQWMLHERSGMVLCLRGDGSLSRVPGNTPEEDVRWIGPADAV